MQRLFIHSLSLTGKDKPSAVLTFKDGLNVIAGASETGKTFIFQCIYYMLGSDDKPKTIPQAIGYTTLTLEFGDEKSAHYRLQRSINGGDFSVKNLLDTSAPDKTIKKNAIYDLIAQHLDLSGRKLKKNQNNETVKLGFPAVRRFLMVDEQHIITESSPIFSSMPSKKVEEKSAFKFMLSGQDDSDLIVSGDTRNALLRKAGKKSVYDGMIQSLTEKIAGTNATEVSEQKEKLGLTIKKHLDSLGSLNSQVSLNLQKKIRNQELMDKITSRQRSINSNLERFNLLLKTYKSDIERINFVIEGKSLFGQLNAGNCPHCGRTMDHVHDDSRVEFIDLESLAAASKAEIRKIQGLISDLNSTIKDLKFESDKLIINERELRNQNAQIENEIKSSLISKIDEIKEKLEDLHEKKDELSEISIFHRELAEVEQKKTTDLASNSADEDETTGEAFNQDYLIAEYCKEVESLLKNWKVSEEPRVGFNLEQYDIVINGKARRSFGKGVRAVLYSAFLVAIRNLAKNKRTIHPHLLIIDSPLTTHEEVDGEVDTGIQQSFFRSLSEFKDFQIIIFDNKAPPADLVPKINFRHFSGVEGAADQGFIPGH